MPKFADIRAWEQAQLLMQPVLIRVLDNLRKQMEQSTWKGDYEETPIWADDIDEATREVVNHLQQQLATASPQEAEAIEEQLARLPSPQMSYVLRLKKADRQITIDIWQLCYQVCFRNYSPVLNALDQNLVVEVDTSLLDETGDIDWRNLDDKAKQLIEQIFNSLSPHRTLAEELQNVETSDSETDA